jgi:hypothetical protein
VEDNTAGRRLGDRSKDLGAPGRKATQVRPVVERRGELGAALPAVPEIAVLADVEGNVDGLDGCGPRRRIPPPLVLVAQVDNRVRPVRDQFLPTPLGQARERIAAHERAAAGAPSVDGFEST